MDFGSAFVSMPACILEVNAGLLKVLPMPNNPLEREWCLVRLKARPAPQMTLACKRFPRQSGQPWA